ncbi:MAG: response regulator [Ekhidna sp.]
MNDQQKTKEQLIKELELNRKALKRTQEIAQIGSWEFHLQTSDLHWSKENYKIFDVDEDTPPGHLFELYRSRVNDAAQLERIDELIYQLIQTGKGYTIEHSIITTDGSKKHIKGIAKALLDDKGNITGIQGTAQDITQQIEQENRRIQQKSVLLELASIHDEGFIETLNKITKLSARALNIARVSIWEFSKDKTGIYCKSLYRLKEEIHEEGLILTAKDHPNYFKALRKGVAIAADDANTDLRTKEFSKDYLTPSGISSMLDVFIKDQSSEKDIGVVCFEHVGQSKKWTETEQRFAMSIANIASLAFIRNERIQAEQELIKAKEKAEESEKKFKNLSLLKKGILESPEGIIVFALDKNYCYLDFTLLHKQTMKAIWAVDIEIGSNMLDYIKFKPDLEKARENFDRVLKGETFVLHEEYGNEELNRTFYENRYSPVYDETNDIIGLAVYVIDITERKRAEQELLIAKEKAEESDHLKSAFLANMSHEIRTPLNAILGFSNILKKKNISEEDKNQYLEFIESSGKNLLNLISDIIDLSRMDSNQLTIKYNSCDVNKLIDLIYERFKVINSNTECEIIVNKGLQDADSIVLTDDNRLSQILSNLLENALKFTERGTVEFGYERRGEILEFFVKDSGLGIAEKDHRAIFDRFRQGDNDYTRSKSGTGLGLSIVKNLVELLGGEIRIESKIKKGATFYFTVPYSQEKKKNVEAKTTGIDPDLSKSKTILIAEDQVINFTYLRVLLERHNYKIIHAKNGQEAVDIAMTERSIDLILMDLGMPLMNGLEAAKTIRKTNKAIPIIAVTGYAMEEDKKNVFEAGCNDYLSKPISEENLIEVLDKFTKKGISKK